MPLGLPRRQDADEERPLLASHPSNSLHSSLQYGATQHQYLTKNQVVFGFPDPQDPQQWSRSAKLVQLIVVSLLSILPPLASSMFNPAIQRMAEDLQTNEKAIIATTTGFMIMLGMGPLVLAPLSEMFGRRPVYLVSFAVFSVLQVPTALSPNVETLIAVRTISGFFGSVGIAIGGGTLSDMYKSSERAEVFGWYLLGPLMGPALGPLFGGIIVTYLNWRWIYWSLAIASIFCTVLGYLFLTETYAPVLLSRRKIQLQQDERELNGNMPSKSIYFIKDEDERSLPTKLRHSLRRPLVIFAQPIVMTMSIYQALLFGTTYSIYTNIEKIFSHEPYDFDSRQIGLLYLGPGLGFLTAIWFLVPKIDVVYNRLTERNNGQELPEFRLPLANIGAVLIPASLFAFAWTVEYRLHWIIPTIATYFYGIGQEMIFITVQNYYIDSFREYAASAIAAGSVFRSVVGGVVPLFAPTMFEKIGYGWGVSVFAFLSLLIAPSPIIFYYYGQRVRDRFQAHF